MKLEQIHKLGIELAIKADLRGADAAKKQLAKARKSYEQLSSRAKEEFDKEVLNNPYMDSRIEFGDPNTEIKKVIAGIDIDSSELLIAKQLGGVDLVIAHHPVGRALIELDEVMHMQAEILAKYGVPINIAQGVMRERITEVARKIHSANNFKTPNAAKLLGMPLLVAHTVCDNLAASFIKKTIEQQKPQTIGEILNILRNIPEYADAAKNGYGPMLFAGSPNNHCGKVVVTEFTGGTEGSKLIYERMSHVGIGTILSMHMGEESRREAEKNHLNVIVAGHMASDSLGMNLLLDQLEKKGIKIIPTSGLIRVSRNKKR